jgi:hypothetical protein
MVPATEEVVVGGSESEAGPNNSKVSARPYLKNKLKAKRL